MRKSIRSLSQLLLAMLFIANTPAVLQAQSTSNSSDMSLNASPAMSDTAFVRKDIMDNTMEIQLSKLGVQKSTNPQVKAVAQQMITEHTVFLNAMKAIARKKNMSEISSGETAMEAGTAGAGMTSMSGSGTGISGTGTIVTSGSSTPIADSLLNSAGATGVKHDMQGMHETANMQALQSASATEFNSLFISQMLQMHKAKIAEIQNAMPGITDPALKTALTKALPKIKAHTATLAKIDRGINKNTQ